MQSFLKRNLSWTLPTATAGKIVLGTEETLVLESIRNATANVAGMDPLADQEEETVAVAIAAAVATETVTAVTSTQEAPVETLITVST